MKNLLAIACLSTTLLLPACASSLEQIVETRHQAKIDAANASRPITSGADDGLGSRIARTSSGLTLTQPSTLELSNKNQ